MLDQRRRKVHREIFITSDNNIHRMAFIGFLVRSRSNYTVTKKNSRCVENAQHRILNLLKT